MDPGSTADLSSDPIRVVVVSSDDQSRRLLVERLQDAIDIVVVGEGQSAAGSIARAKSNTADVVVVDASLGDGTGEEICRRLRVEGPRCGCIILAGIPAASRSSPIGADAVVLKELAGDTLERQIRRVGTAIRSEPERPCPARSWHTSDG